MKTRIFLVAVFCLVTGSIRDGDEDETFIVIRASPNTTNQLDYVRELHDNMHTYDLDFWLTPHTVGHFADVMVRESRLPWLRDQLAIHGVNHFVSVPDVQKLIIDREQKGKNKNLRFMQILNDFRKRYKDEGGNKARYGFGDYHSYEVITNWMHEIERQYPDRAKVMVIGETDEKRPIKTIKLGTNIQSTNKRVVWIDGGIHAREWAAVHTTNYFIDRLIADYDTDPLVREAMDNLHFYVTPVMNPDGYEYSRTGVSPMIRLWRKNRSNMVCKKDRWFRDRCCGGVDLNRNFDWFWGGEGIEEASNMIFVEIGSSSDRCSEIYQGSDVWSEAESRAVRDMMFSPELRGKVDAFITLHTYSQMWIHPFSHQRKTVPEDIADTEEVGRKAVSALEAMYGTKYRFGTGADILYPSSGGSDDWAKGKGGAKYVYLLELRPGEEVWDGFILDSRQLMPTAKETWAGVKVVIDAVLKRLRRVAPQPPALLDLNFFQNFQVANLENSLQLSSLFLGVLKELYRPNRTEESLVTLLATKEPVDVQLSTKGESQLKTTVRPGVFLAIEKPALEPPLSSSQEFPGFGLSDLHSISPVMRKEEFVIEEELIEQFEKNRKSQEEGTEVAPALKTLEVEGDSPEKEDEGLKLLDRTENSAGSVLMESNGTVLSPVTVSQIASTVVSSTDSLSSTADLTVPSASAAHRKGSTTTMNPNQITGGNSRDSPSTTTVPETSTVLRRGSTTTLNTVSATFPVPVGTTVSSTSVTAMSPTAPTSVSRTTVINRRVGPPGRKPDFERKSTDNSRETVTPTTVSSQSSKETKNVLVSSQKLQFSDGDDSLPSSPVLKAAIFSNVVENDLSSPVLVAIPVSKPRTIRILVPTTSSTTTTSTTTTTQAPTTTTKRIEIVRPRVGFRPRSRVRPVVMRSEAARQLLAERFRQQHNNLVAENSSRRNNFRRGQNNARFVSGNVQNTAPTVVEHFPQQTSVTSPTPVQQSRPQQAPCLDKSPWCGAWIQGNANICQISSVYMRRDCARSCRYCS